MIDDGDAAVVDVRAPCEGVGGDREDEDDGEDDESSEEDIMAMAT